ncbi:unnamed protein product [Brassica napus]|nr:unnamed protein product [Brassica napus]
MNSTGLIISNLTFLNSPFWNINPSIEVEERVDECSVDDLLSFISGRLVLRFSCINVFFPHNMFSFVGQGVNCGIINNPWAQSRLSTLYAYSPFIGYVLSLECVSKNKTMKKHDPYRFYNGLLAAQGFSQSPEAAEVLFREMVWLRLAPTKVTFLAESSRQRDKFRVFVVKIYAADVENLEEKLETLVMEHESLEEYNEPKNKTKKKKIDTHGLYNALLSAHGYSESPEAAEVLLKGMVGCGFAPTDITFRVMMKALGNSGKSGLAPGYK